jgi:hypothetical protein
VRARPTKERQKQALKEVMADEKEGRGAGQGRRRRDRRRKRSWRSSVPRKTRSAPTRPRRSRQSCKPSSIGRRRFAAQRQAEQDKKQAVFDRKKNEEIAEAQARLDQAKKAYEAEVAKINAQNQPQ